MESDTFETTSRFQEDERTTSSCFAQNKTSCTFSCICVSCCESGCCVRCGEIKTVHCCIDMCTCVSSLDVCISCCSLRQSCMCFGSRDVGYFQTREHESFCHDYYHHYMAGEPKTAEEPTSPANCRSGQKQEATEAIEGESAKPQNRMRLN